MNIFYLDECPIRCAKFHCDKHVVKMVLESAQILSTVWRHYYPLDLYSQLSFNPDILYNITHPKHPSIVWASLAKDNYKYLYNLAYCLSHEYSFRYYKKHKSFLDVIKHLKVPPQSMPDGSTPVALAMDVRYYHENPVVAYRSYYKYGKVELLQYTNREKPYWL